MTNMTRRTKAIAELNAGATNEEVVAKYGIKPQSIGAWKRLGYLTTNGRTATPFKATAPKEKSLIEWADEFIGTAPKLRDGLRKEITRLEATMANLRSRLTTVEALIPPTPKPSQNDDATK